jgi:hypothetical protein
LLSKGSAVHAFADGGNDDLGFLLEPHLLDDLSQDLDRDLSVLLNWVLQTEHKTLAQLVLVEDLQDFSILL